MQTLPIIATAKNIAAALTIAAAGSPQIVATLADTAAKIDAGTEGRVLASYVCPAQAEGEPVRIFYAVERDGIRRLEQFTGNVTPWELWPCLRLCAMNEEAGTLRFSDFVRQNNPAGRALCAVECKTIPNVFFAGI